MRSRIATAVGSAAAIGAIATGVALAAPVGAGHGPSTSTDPYVLPVGDGVSIKSIFTVGDGAAGNGYRMVGIPDGLGAYQQRGSRDFTLLMNQELRDSQGVVRRHGQMGAFVSELKIDSDSYRVQRGADLIDPDIRFWDYVAQRYRSNPSGGGTNPRDRSDTFAAEMAAFSRFCSSSLTGEGVLFDRRSKRGYRGQIYFANEENGDGGRVFGVTTDGQAEQLPRLGLASWENTQLAAGTGDRTLTVGDEDGSSAQLWAHVGTKQRTGNPFDQAGLTNGSNYVVDLVDESVSTNAEFRATYGKGKAVRFSLGADEKVNWDQSGPKQNSDAAGKGLSLNRIEDGSWDPRNPNDYYFTTTEGSPGTVPSDPSVSRDGGGLWRLHFNNVARPERGGTLTLLLDGTEAPYLNKPDNITIDTKGNLLIQEDPGNNAQLARIIAYRIKNGDRGVLAEFDESQFAPGGSHFLTQDEESSGIIDAKRILRNGAFLFDAQVHAPSGDPETVEYGQLLAMDVRNFRDVYTIDGDR